MKFTNLLIGLLTILSIACNQPKGQQKIDLSGTWKFAVDPNDKGVSEKWFSQPLADQVTLPGSMSTNGKGDDITMDTKWT